jgi:hypothetical protein
MLSGMPGRTMNGKVDLSFHCVCVYVYGLLETRGRCGPTREYSLGGKSVERECETPCLRAAYGAPHPVP